MIKKENKQKKIKRQNDKPRPQQCHIHFPSQCHCACPYLKIDSKHQPLLIRTCIVASGILVGFLGYAWGWCDGEILFWKLGMMAHLHYCLTVALTCYFCWVTLWDGLTHFVFRLKPSSFSDEETLLKIAEVTPQELDRYVDTRRNIRFVSLIVATGAYGLSSQFGLFAPLTAFCVAYIVSTILGIFGVRCFYKGRLPKLVHRDDRYYNPALHRPSISASEYMINYSRYSRGDTSFYPIW